MTFQTTRGTDVPKLAVLSYDAVTVGETVEGVPEIVERMYSKTGSAEKTLRMFRNNVVFVVADKVLIKEMRDRARHFLALREMNKPHHLDGLADYQKAKVRELLGQADMKLSVMVQQCYRHTLLPVPQRGRECRSDTGPFGCRCTRGVGQAGSGQRPGRAARCGT